MKIDELDGFLQEYTEDELFYKEHYQAFQSPKAYKSFLDNMDLDFVKNKKIIIPDLFDDAEVSYMLEERLFRGKEKFNVLPLKHYRYTPQFSHKHTFFEMSYVYSGSFIQRIGEDEIVLNEGDVCILSPEVEHSVGIYDDTILLNFLIRKSTFNSTFLEVLSDENLLSSFFSKILYTNNFNRYIIFRTNNNPECRDILCRIFYEALENKRYCNKVLDNLIMVFFAYLLRDESIKIELPQEVQKSNRYLMSIIAYIQGNYKTVTLDSLSKKFHFSAPYLSKVIKISTGHTFKEMLQTIKLNKAVELITSSNLMITDISHAVGYENPAHFIRLFKKVYGVSPNQYRKHQC